ncbi:cyclin-F isoform X3 [Castor canadensis]|uniref:Cyclin-F n=1 Tax=Castor canadensis TaxID=51338 RepID=A0A8B7V9V2_CASCN|nr:cyclin-F isoform X1 [Castor canadensis]
MGSGGVIHCRCAKCFCYPTKRRIRRRPRNLTILSLPEDVLFHILKWLSVGDILAVRAVHSHLKYLVDSHASVWACASFQELWPSPKNLKLFERAAEKGNFEAAVKLGIAYLYNEGLSVSDEARAEVNGLKASRFFSLAERLNVGAEPFIWLFIRPPWSVSGSCCKAVVHESLRAECQLQRTHKASILHCLGRVLSLFEDEEKRKQARELLEEAAHQGCLASSYLLWESDRKTDVSDPGRCLHSFRKLRDYAAKGCWEAQLALAKACANGNQLGLEGKACNEIVCQLFQGSQAISKQQVFSVQKGLNDTMRYILIDWLVEVATMKDFTSLCLHLTVECVDRYLRRRLVPRYKLQLLGIACMVICTRFISKEILTIREAVWLTDNTYKYEDLVRMMGEIVSALEGKIRIPTVVDYKEVLLTLVPVAPRTQHLCSFLCELSLLHTSLSAFAPAHLASAALLLARLMHGQTQPWTTRMWDLTGFSYEDLMPCVLSLHKKCFHDDAPKDYRQVSLTAVKQRFEDKRYEEISQEEVLSYGQLCATLGVKQESPEPPSFLSAGEIHTFLSSPSGRRTKRKRENSLQEDRGSFVTTPTAELSSQEETLLGSFLDWSLDCYSGYEGDQESEGEKEGDGECGPGCTRGTLCRRQLKPRHLAPGAVLRGAESAWRAGTGCQHHTLPCKRASRHRELWEESPKTPQLLRGTTPTPQEVRGFRPNLCPVPVGSMLVEGPFLGMEQTETLSGVLDEIFLEHFFEMCPYGVYEPHSHLLSPSTSREAHHPVLTRAV